MRTNLWTSYRALALAARVVPAPPVVAERAAPPSAGRHCGPTNETIMAEKTIAPVYLDAEIEERAAGADAGERVVHVIASTGALDSHGSVLRQNWNLERYAQNPVVLFAHRRDELPIARARNVKVTGSTKADNKRLEADIEFPPPGKFARSDEVWQALEAGLVRGISVGFQPRKVLWEEHDGRDVMVCDDNELLELSIVPVGSNPEALAAARERALAEYRSTAAPAAPVMENRMDPKLLARDLGLPEDATENQIRTQAAGLSKLLADIGAPSLDAARGVIEAGKAAAEALPKAQARVAELERAAEDRERDALIAKLEGEKRLTPAQRDGFAKTASLETLRAFAATAPVVVAPSQHHEAAPAPVTAKEAERWNGKTFAELTPNERHALYREDADLYRRLRDGN